jgi:hypothetical protein
MMSYQQDATNPSDDVPTNWATASRLGPLQDLPGFWEGTGFSLIARPNFSGGNPNKIFLQLNLLRESLEITTIGSPVTDRGSLQDDISIYGLNYLHRVTDGVTGAALHIEPGQWLYIPPTSEPKADASVVRQGCIPHGNAFCSVGFSENAVFEGLPDIPPANTVPFVIGATPPPAGTKNPFIEYDLSVPSPFRSDNLPAQITQALINDPNQMLRDDLIGQKPLKIVRLITMTPPAGGIGNIPFITSNADAGSVESVFAIETMATPNGQTFLQLQYSQTVLLNFNGMSFPHVTVGTLIKAF